MLADRPRRHEPGPRVRRSTTRSPPRPARSARWRPALPGARSRRVGRRPATSGGSWCSSRSPSPARRSRRSLSPAVEPAARADPAPDGARLGRSRPIVLRLAGAVRGRLLRRRVHRVSAFIAYWFAAPLRRLRRRRSASSFVAVGVLQTVSFLAAGRLAERFGLLTHDGVHPPAVEPAARRDGVRAEPADRGRAAARPRRAVADGRPDPPGLRDGAGRPGRADRRGRLHQHRPLRRPARSAPLLGGARRSRSRSARRSSSPASIKTAYDLVLWRWFRTVPLPEPRTTR